MDENAATPKIPLASSDTELPKKYIRTFAGDMETVKKGGTPDLVPLQEPSVPSDVPVLDTTVVEKAVVPPPPVAPVAAPIPTPTPTPAPATITIAPPPEELEPAPVVVPEEPKPTPLKTYTGDFSDRMKETHASTATVLAAEQDSQPRTPRVASQAHTTSRSGLLYVIAGVVLCVAGGVGVYVAYTRYLAVSAPVVLTPTVTAPIFVDDREQVSGVGADLARALETSVSRPLASGAVRLLYLATTTDSVFSALRLPAPDILLRNVNASGSMAGVVNVAGSQTLFFILSAASYSNTFSGMLSWETLMPRDIGALLSSFVAVPSVSTATTSVMTATVSTSSPQATTTSTVTTTLSKTASTTSTGSGQATTPGFRDDVVANHDVRIYRNAADEEVLLYGYWNQTTLIIAHDSGAFAEIVQRLATSYTR